MKKEREAHSRNEDNFDTSLKRNNVDNDSGREKWEKYGQRKFNFPTSFKRHILLKFFYLGWNYQGFTVQEHTNNTIGGAEF